jgi:hypothetical protein
MNFDLICNKELGCVGWSVTTPTSEKKAFHSKIVAVKNLIGFSSITANVVFGIYAKKRLVKNTNLGQIYRN